MFAGAAGAASGDTWSGTWARGEIAGDLILEQSGSSVSGHYTWNDGSGKASGTVSGSVLTAGFTETNYEGNFVLTLSGKHFSGSYTGKNKNTGGPISGPFTGTCIAGPCLQNGAPAAAENPAPVIVPPATSWGMAVLGAAGPGATALVSSPPITADTKAVSAEVVGLSEEDVVTLNGLRRQCFVDFTRTLARSLVLVRAVVAREIASDWSAKNPEESAGLEEQIVAEGLAGLVECTRLVDAVTAVLAKGARASAAATSCGFVPVKLSVSGSRLRSLRVGRVGDRGQSLQVSCTRIGGGVRISLKARAGASLRSVVGSRLRIGIRRSRHDSAGGQLSTTFRRR